MDEPMQATTRTQSREGAPAQFQRRWAVENPRGRVLLVHGFGEHSGRYGHVAQKLNDLGLDVSAFDLRGHGESGGPRVFIRRFGDYLDDLSCALEPVVQEAKGEPIFLLGHSMGGQIATRFVQQNQPPLSGLILSSPAFGFAVKVPLWKALAGRFFSKFWPALALPSGLNRDLLSHDPQVAEALANDPHAQLNATARWYTECLDVQPRLLEDAPGVKIPLLCMLAGADEITQVKASRDFFEAALSKDKECIEYPGLYHEIFNELERDNVLQDLADWLGRHLPAQP